MTGRFRSQLNLLLLSDSARLARAEEGSALVEMAISSLLLFMLLFGVIEVSLTGYSFHFVANAAHEATRYAIVRGGSWSSSCDSGTAGSGYNSSMCQATPADVANFVASRNFPGVNITAADVCVEYFSSLPSSASTTCSTSSSPIANAPGDIVQVTITYPFNMDIPGLPTYNLNLSSTSQMTIAN